ncbi:hypothetical protein [uncultured Hymenobacter sp.]|uniref:hypothetical protein n=1 Tax=uncultured Hymenobacter sp. TaxID=170016 RepID=UPI0035CA4FE2
MSTGTNVYTSDRSAIRAFAQLLAEKSTQPVRVRPLTELPSPDTQRPTRQQLRQERAAIEPALKGLLVNIGKAEGNRREYGHMLPDMQAMRDRYELRLEDIKRALDEQQGGQANG